MTIKLYNFSKKHNSTARPPSESSTEMNIVLKERTSFNNPIFILQISGVLQYNYVYWVDIDHYYYISDIVSVNNNIWELHCEIDALATCRQYIINADSFVKYSTLNFNQYLRDDRIQPTSDLTSLVSNNNFSADFNEHPEYTSSYSLLLTVLNGELSGEGSNNSAGIRHYLINSNNLRYLCEKLVEDGESVIGGVKQIFADAKSSLIKLQLVPWSIAGLQRQSIIGSGTTPIFLGDYDTGQSGYVMDANACYEANDFVDIPTLPDDFTKVEPYCEAKLHIPLIGTFDLSLSELADTNRLYFRYIANIASGRATCIIWKGNANINNSAVKIIGAYNGDINADVPLGYITSSNPTGAFTGTLALAGAAIGSGALAVGGGIAGAIAGFSSFFKKQGSVVNAFGGNASAKDNLKLSIYVMKRGLSEQPANMAALYGRPCGKVLNLSTLVNGYVECSQFELQAPFDDAIVQKVNSLMNAGVYLQ